MPVIVLVSGQDGAGKGETINILYEWMDPRFISTLAFSAPTDEERAANSARVLSWWDDIQAAKAKIAHYEQHGELPMPAEDGDDLPDNAALLAKKLNSLRARISQVKKKITDIAGLDESTPGKQSKINAAENDLKRLRYLEGKAAVKLKEYESAA